MSNVYYNEHLNQTKIISAFRIYNMKKHDNVNKFFHSHIKCVHVFTGGTLYRGCDEAACDRQNVWRSTRMSRRTSGGWPVTTFNRFIFNIKQLLFP